MRLPRTWPGKLNGPPMTLGNMRQLGVQRLVAYCLNPSCRHEGLIDVSRFPDDAEVPSFAKKVVCAKCGARGNSKGEPVEAVARIHQYPATDR